MHVQLVGMSPVTYNFMHSHTHDVWEIVLNYQGSGQMDIGGLPYSFCPGSIICQPPNVPHTKQSQEGFRDIYIQIPSFPLEKFTDQNEVLVLQDDNEKSFQTLIFMAHRIFHSPGRNSQNLLDALMDTMLQLMFCWQESTAIDPDVEQLKNQMILSFTDPEFSIADLLESCPYCSDYMRRRFKQVTGKKPLEYLTELRIEYAKKLIRENDVLHYSITEIGTMSGYYDSHYFSRIFKKTTGMTPQEYLNAGAAHRL